jgi:molybdenum cofactor cytidylyltransferase
MTAAVILAAGEGRRMGGPKALLILDGESLLQRTVRVAMAAGCDPVIAVVGDWDPGPLDAAVSVAHNRKASEGMASSIRAGIAALAPGIESALILTVDQPTVDATLLRKLLALAIEDPDNPAACAYGNSLGIPAVLPRRLFADLMALKGDRGAKAILLRERTTALPFPEGEADLDSPEDLERIRR